MDEEESDYESSGFWKEKHDNALSALESCEKSKQMLEKHNEELRRKGDETRARCESLNTKINALTERYKTVEKDREIIRNSKNEMSQTLANMKRELSTEREKTVQFKQKLEEKEAAIKQLIEEEKCFSEVYEKSVVKSKALEEFGNELIAAKEHLESKVGLYETKILDKEAEIKQLQGQMKTQFGDFDELRKAVLGIISELGSLKDALEENRQKKIEFSQGIVDLRKRFQAKNEQLAEECYARTLDLEKAQKNCEIYCRKIKDLETAFIAARKSYNTNDAEAARATVTFTEDELKQVNDYRQEIQNLRELLAAERLTRLQLEGKYDKYCEYRQHWKEKDDPQKDMEGPKKPSNVKKQGNELNREATMKLTRELTQLFGEDMDPEHENETGMIDNEKNGKSAEDDNKLEKELKQLRKKCAMLADRNEELRAENEWLSSMHDEKREEPFALKSDMDSLKLQVSQLQESTVDMGADREDIDRLKSQCAALNEEKSALMKVVDDLKTEECSLTKEIEEIRQSQWKMKQERTMSNLMTYELDRAPTEGRFEKDLMVRKGGRSQVLIPFELFQFCILVQNTRAN